MDDLTRDELTAIGVSALDCPMCCPTNARVVNMAIRSIDQAGEIKRLKADYDSVMMTYEIEMGLNYEALDDAQVTFFVAVWSIWLWRRHKSAQIACLEADNAALRIEVNNGRTMARLQLEADDG